MTIKNIAAVLLAAAMLLIPLCAGAEFGKNKDSVEWWESEQRRETTAVGRAIVTDKWCKQLSLNYANYNLRIYDGDEQQIFLEQLHWAGGMGSPSKQLYLRTDGMISDETTLRIDKGAIIALKNTDIDYLLIKDRIKDVFKEISVMELLWLYDECYRLQDNQILVLGMYDEPAWTIDENGELVQLEVNEEAYANFQDYGGSGGRTVYISQTGDCYHFSPDCSNMRNPSDMSLIEAQNRGYSPCSNCVY